LLEVRLLDRQRYDTRVLELTSATRTSLVGLDDTRVGRDPVARDDSGSNRHTAVRPFPTCYFVSNPEPGENAAGRAGERGHDHRHAKAMRERERVEIDLSGNPREDWQ
jgi:hypothetical protein